MRKIFLTSITLTMLVVAGCSEQAGAPPAIQSKAKATSKQPTGIPDQPVKGMVNGREMVADRAQIKGGTLTIRQGEEFFASRQLKIFLFDEGSMSGRRIDGSGTNGFAPHVHVSWMDEGWNVPKTEIVSSGYELSLSFGKETKFGLPYAIRFKTDKIKDTHVVGKGFATFEEIKVRDGDLDRTFDSFDTLGYIAREYLQQKSGGNVEIVDRFAGRYSSDKGYLGVEYKADGGERLVARLQLQKDDGGWKVVNQLADTELEAAHPLLEEPSSQARHRSASYMERTTARYIEDEYNKQGLVPYFRRTAMDCSMVKGYEEGNCEFSFEIKRPEGEECVIRNFHLKFADKWSIVGELDAGYRYDFKSGELVEDEYPSRLCRQRL